jgi:hypothetical protein
MHVAFNVIKTVMELQCGIFARSLAVPFGNCHGAEVWRFNSTHVCRVSYRTPVHKGPRDRRSSISFINGLLCVNVFAVPLYPATF